ncbi:MAG: hypothetical protein HYS06_11985 [Methylocystis sp.]|nr:hypothetical protein [Methylocystis sp.]MBI3275680.1 hypothetical protein [Methylocystis sp.]
MRTHRQSLPIELAHVSILLRICQSSLRSHNQGVAAMIGFAADELDFGRRRRGTGWNLVGVVSGAQNPRDFGGGALERRSRHDEDEHEDGRCRRRHHAFGRLV